MDTRELLNSPMQRGRTLKSKQVEEFMSDLNTSFENKKILEIGCGKGNVLRDIKLKYNCSELYGVDIFTPEKENLNYFQHLSLNLNDSKHISRIPDKLDIIFSFRCFMYLSIDIRIQTIKTYYSKLKMGGVMLIDMCGTPESPSEISDNDLVMLSYISKNLNKNDKLIKKNYKVEVELLENKPSDKELKMINRIKDIETYSLIIIKTSEEIKL